MSSVDVLKKLIDCLEDPEINMLNNQKDYVKVLQDSILALEKLEKLKKWLDKNINRSNARADIWSVKITKCFEEVRLLL